MAKVERLNKTIIPQLTDPGAVGRAAQLATTGPLGAATQALGAGADILQARVNEDRRIKDLQEQTEMARRSAEYQNQAFDIVNQNREQFKSNPDAGIEDLDNSLRTLSEDLGQGLSPKNQATLNRSQEVAMGRFGLQQREWARNQTKTNTQNNINGIGKEYLTSAKLAGETGDFDRLAAIAEDVSVLNQQAGGVFEGKRLSGFTTDLKDGIVENFSDAMMFSKPQEFLKEIEDGTFDDVFSQEQKSDKITETQKFIETQNEQADFNRNLNFLDKNAGIAKLVSKGQLSFNDVDDMVAAGDISPEMGETKRNEILNGKIKITTDPIAYGNLKARADRLLRKQTVTETDDEGRITETQRILGTESLEEALQLQQDIADAQLSNVSPSDGNTLTKMVQIGISNTVAVDGITDSLSVNHYKETSDAFEEQGLGGQELLNALRAYSVEADRTGLDELNDQLAQTQPSVLSRILPGSTAATTDKREQNEDISGQVERLSKANRNKVLKSVAIKRNPSLSTFQGDLPNNVLEKGVLTPVLPGGDVKGDITLEEPFDRKIGKDGRTYRIFKDGTFEVEE